MNNIKKSDTSYPLRDTSSGHENHNSSLRQNRSVVQHGLSSYSCTHQTFCNVCSMSHSTAIIVSRKTLFVKLEFKMPTSFCARRHSLFLLLDFAFIVEDTAKLDNVRVSEFNQLFGSFLASSAASAIYEYQL